MSRQVSISCFVILFVACGVAKDKKKQPLPDNVLGAETVLVVIHPEAGEPLNDPRANRRAHDDVEQALMTWGRFRVVKDTETADLIIAVRKGHANGPTVRNAPADTIIFPPTHRQPPLTNPPLDGSTSRGPHISNEAGPSEDMLEVYMGKVQNPLDSAPIWRYMAKDALIGPQVKAVEQFQNAVNESEKQHQGKP